MHYYCNSLTDYSRLQTREVKVGDLLLGNLHPIRVQTMTTTDTMDTMATVEQSIRCIEAGAELVRITAPSKRDAENLLNIKNELRKRGYSTPLVADIHFTPNAAEIAARIVEKVRVNPGNYVDKKKFEQIEYTNVEYLEEIDRIRERFVPLVKICKEYGTAMRIGTNHGSLSDRIMSRYGDTPMGMVESAMEFLRIARAEDYHNIVLSMKSSNPQVMVQAYRLLVHQMSEEFGQPYPLHLGVTEAGDGEDGRIKSAIGIGALLEDGIGDTIRVSLTEDPEFEIPVCKDLVSRYANREHNPLFSFRKEKSEIIKLPYSPFEYKRRISKPVENIGGKQVPVVVADFMQKDQITPVELSAAGYDYNENSGQWIKADASADYIYSAGKTAEFPLPESLKVICNIGTWQSLENKENYYPLFQGVEYLDIAAKSDKINFIGIDTFAMDKLILQHIFDAAKLDPTAVFCFFSTSKHAMPNVRKTIVQMMEQDIQAPVILCVESKAFTADEQLIQFSAEAGSLFLDGMGDGIWLMNDPAKLNNVKVSGRNYIPILDTYQFLNATAFSILQATRTRISKTEYISCPSCGRTLFELQETTAKIRAKTNHLKGVKIAIMGCIVNGPGEMADADFGYVGSGPGRITLYKGKDIVKRNVDSKIAVDELIDLLKDNGVWVEP